MNQLRAASWLVRDLGLALQSGASVPAALEGAAQTAPIAWKPGLQRAQSAARSGASLSDALRQAACLPELLIVGLETSSEPAACARLADLLSDQEARLRELRAALHYPAWLAGVLLLAFWLMLWVVGGSLSLLVSGSNLQVPLLTRWLLGLHHMVLQPGLLAGQLVVLTWLVGLLLGWWGTGWRLRLPLLGPWLRRGESIAWLSWVDHSLAEGQVTAIPQAMRRAAGACLDAGFRRRVERAALDCERGTPWHEALRRGKVLPELAQWFMARGAELEYPPGFLSGVAGALRREQELESTGGMACLELLAVVGVALAVPLLAASFLLPVYQLVGNL